MLPQQYCLRWKYHHSNLQTMFSQLLDRGCFCDVTLACDGQIIRAHRVVLCACSTFFDTILTNYATDKDPIIIMKDAKYADVKYLVEFMYKGEINVEHANLASLLKTAEELKIKGLAEVSWRDDDAMDAPMVEPETKLHGCSASQEKELSAHQFNYMNNNNNNINAIDEISQIPNHRIPRMPLLTPIPSPNQNLDQFSLKRKRGRPPLDDTYDIFSAQKISQMKSLSSAIHNIPTAEKNNNNSNSCKRSSPNRDNSDMSSLLTEPNQLVNNTETDTNSKSDSANPKDQKVSNKDWSKRKNQDNSQDNDSEVDEKPSVEQLEKSVAAAVAAASANENAESNEKNDNNNHQNIPENVQTGNEYFDDIDDASLLDSQNNGEDDMSDGQEHDSGELGDGKHYVLTQAELEEWKDVIKMDAYLAIGRRPQFWEEPFTKRVLEAIKTKKLEMKKAAQVLGVSYGTLYGRYREVYGCLKHPYRGLVSRFETWQVEQITGKN